MSAQNNHQFDFESFQGFSPPYYTPVPDLLFDGIMQDLNAGELKTLLYIIRRTFGFKRSSDDISLAQMLNGITTKDGRRLDRGTGLTKKTLLKSLRSLKDKNVIEVRRNRSEEKGDMATTYRLKMAPAPKEKSTPPRGGKSTPGGWGKKYTTQETVIQETEHESEVDLNNNNSSGEPDAKHDVVVALIDKGISQHVAQRLAHRYSRRRILEKIDFLEYLQEADPKKVTNPHGWLRKAIEEDYSTPDGYQSRAEREKEEKEKERRRQAIIDQQTKQAAQQQQQREQERRKQEQKLKELKNQHHTTPATEKLWRDWKSHIEAADGGGPSLILTGCELLAIDDTQVVLWVANEIVKQQFLRRYGKTVKQLAAKHLKLPFAQVELTLITETEQPEEMSP